MFRKEIGEGGKKQSGQVRAQAQQRALIFVMDNGYARMCMEEIL